MFLNPLGHRFGLVWYSCCTQAFVNPLRHEYIWIFESATNHPNQRQRISDLGHRFGLVWYNCYTLIFLNPLGHRFWSPILVSNSGLQFWSPILVSDSGLRFSVTDSVILVSDSDNPVTDSAFLVSDSAFLVSDSQSPIRLSWSPILVSDSDAALMWWPPLLTASRISVSSGALLSDRSGGATWGLTSFSLTKVAKHIEDGGPLPVGKGLPKQYPSQLYSNCTQTNNLLNCVYCKQIISGLHST